MWYIGVITHLLTLNQKFLQHPSKPPTDSDSPPRLRQRFFETLRQWSISHEAIHFPLPFRHRFGTLRNRGIRRKQKKRRGLAVLCALFGMVKWPFQRLSDLQLGNQKVTLNHQEG